MKSYLENSKIINDKIINKSNKEIEINLQKIKDVEKRVAKLANIYFKKVK